MNTEALKVLSERRSVRSYKPEQITAEELEAVLWAGMYAPSAKGCQDVVIVAVQEPEMLARVRRLNAEIMGKPDADPYYGAPTVILVLSDPEIQANHELALLDGAAAETNMLNAACAAGLGSCWINRPQKMFETEEGKQMLRDMGLKDTLTGIASIALGYADGEVPEAKPRKEGYAVVY